MASDLYVFQIEQGQLVGILESATNCPEDKGKILGHLTLT